MAIGVFFTITNIFTVVRWTLIEPGTLLRFLALACFIGNLLPHGWAAGRFGMARLEWFLFNLIGAGPLLMGMLLWANFLLHSAPQTSDHRVAEVGQGHAFRLHTFTDGLWQDYPMARSFTRDKSDAIGYNVRITTATGLFHMPVVVEIGPVPARDHRTPSSDP